MFRCGAPVPCDADSEKEQDEQEGNVVTHREWLSMCGQIGHSRKKSYQPIGCLPAHCDTARWGLDCSAVFSALKVPAAAGGSRVRTCWGLNMTAGATHRQHHIITNTSHHTYVTPPTPSTPHLGREKYEEDTDRFKKNRQNLLTQPFRAISGNYLNLEVNTNHPFQISRIPSNP